MVSGNELLSNYTIVITRVATYIIRLFVFEWTHFWWHYKYDSYFILSLFKVTSNENNIKCPWTIAFIFIFVIFYSYRYLNIIGIQYQSPPKSAKYGVFEQKYAYVTK